MAKEKAIVNTESKLKSLFMMRNDLAECEAQLEALLAERAVSNHRERPLPGF